MPNTQQLADLHMALHINAQLYAGGKITAEMHAHAARVFTERLALQEPAKYAKIPHRTHTTK